MANIVWLVSYTGRETHINGVCREWLMMYGQRGWLMVFPFHVIPIYVAVNNIRTENGVQAPVGWPTVRRVYHAFHPIQPCPISSDWPLPHFFPSSLPPFRLSHQDHHFVPFIPSHFIPFSSLPFRPIHSSPLWFHSPLSMLIIHPSISSSYSTRPTLNHSPRFVSFTPPHIVPRNSPHLGPLIPVIPITIKNGLVRHYILHMSQHENPPDSIPWRIVQSLNSRFDILCACALLHTANTHTHTHTHSRLIYLMMNRYGPQLRKSRHRL